MAWQPIWSDNFDGPVGTKPNPLWWVCADDIDYDTPTTGYSPAQVQLDGAGNVVITAEPKLCHGRPYASGHIETQVSPLHNLFQTPADNWAVECSVQLPTGKGIWAYTPFGLGADWNFAPPPGRLWPSCGEWDNGEWYQLPRNQVRINLIHGDGSWETHIVTLPFNIDEGQHRYRTECKEGMIRCLIDEIAYIIFQKATVPNWMGTYDQPFVLLSAIEVGGNGGTPDATTRWPVKLIMGSIKCEAWVPDPITAPPALGGQTMNAIQAVAKSAGWNVAGTNLYAWGVPNWLEFDLAFDGTPQALTLTLDANWNNPVPGSYRYHFDVMVDTVTLGSLDIAPSTSGTLTLTKSVGTHRVRVTWTNDFYQPPNDANVQVKSISLGAGSSLPVPPLPPLISARDRAMAKLTGLGFLDDEVLATVNP